MSNTNPINKRVNAGAREGSAVPTTYKTPAILFIYTVKSGESLGSARGQNKFSLKVIDPLLFEIWIFRILNQRLAQRLR